jgi:hypothetical protein
MEPAASQIGRLRPVPWWDTLAPVGLACVGYAGGAAEDAPVASSAIGRGGASAWPWA